MNAELHIPDAAADAGAEALAGYQIADSDQLDASWEVLQAAGPALVAAALRRFAGELLTQRDLLRASTTATTKHTRMAGLEEAASMARARATELELQAGEQ